MRLRPILAIARRDLRIELGGRRGAVLPLIAGIILFPMAGAPEAGDVRKVLEYPVAGAVPEDVLNAEQIIEQRTQNTLYFQEPEGPDKPWILTGFRVPAVVRDRMDARETRYEIVNHERTQLKLPARSLFLSLIAASILTGALSQSVPGERSGRTLEPLLTASITPMELVTGKWLAWGGFGTLAAALAVGITVALGRQPPGPWMIAVPWVSLGTVALGLFLVRRANDVVGGATVALRMLPALLSFLGLAAFYLGYEEGIYGASVPIGGALVASGASWGWGVQLWACLVTAVTCALLLWITARDLSRPEQNLRAAGWTGAVLQIVFAAGLWWSAILGSLLWTAGAAEERTLAIPREAGVVAAAGGLLLLAGVLAARAARPKDVFGLRRPPMIAWVAAAVVGIGLALTGPVSGLVPLPDTTALSWMRVRLAMAVNPTWIAFPAAFAAILGQELLFRGWIRTHGGDLVSIAGWTAVFFPFDPLRGLLSGMMLAALARAADGSLAVVITARLVWWAAAGAGVGLGPLGALALGCGISAVVAAPSWWRDRSGSAAPAAAA